MNEENMKVYGTIGSFRLIDIKVIEDDNNVLYEGTAEDAPVKIKSLKYSKVKTGKIMEFSVYSNLQ